MLKVGLIGNGAIAGAHKNGYRKLVEEGIATIVAICDIRPERLTGDAVLGFEDARKTGGLPVPAKDSAILERYAEMSAPFGVKMKINGNIAEVEV